MKRALFLVAVLFFTSHLAWAQGAGTAPAPVADPRVGGGHCQLPNLAGLSPEQRAAAVLNAGLQMTYADIVVGSPYPACPTTFKCNSLANCQRGSICNVTVIGPCCHDGSAVLCCQGGGDIAVDRCACECPLDSGGCSLACLNSTNISVSCFLVPAS